jgi:hypothetical protein
MGIVVMLTDRFSLSIATGFIVFCIGGVARAYMDFAVNGWKMFYVLRRGNTELAYWRLRRQQQAPAWPLFVALTCMPLGIIILVGSIIFSDHLRR